MTTVIILGSGKAVGAAMLLSTANCPDAGGDNLYARQDTRYPVFFNNSRIHVHSLPDSTAVNRQSHITNAEHDSAFLQLIDPDVNRTHSGKFIFPWFRFPEHVAN